MARLTPGEQATANAVAEDLADRITARLTGPIRYPLYSDEPVRTPPGFRQANEGDSLGALIAHSTQLAEWNERYPGGAPSAGATDRSAPIEVPTLLRSMIAAVRARTLLTSADTSAGDLVIPLERGLVEPGRVRPIRLLSLVTRLPISTDTVHFVKEASRIEGASPVAEATALTGSSGTKPEGGLVFDVVTDLVRTLALWVPASKRILSYAPQLQAYVNEYITYDLSRELEDQILAGDGLGENLLGILNAGIQTQTQQPDENNYDSIRRAKQKIVSVGRTTPTAVVMNSEDAAELDIAKSGSAAAPFGYWSAGPYGISAPQVWGMPIVESDAITAGTALVGDFGRAVLYDRESATLSVGTADSDFVRNVVRVLGELRVGFAVVRPSAFVAVTLV